jgi:hypothetical protein
MSEDLNQIYCGKSLDMNTKLTDEISMSSNADAVSKTVQLMKTAVVLSTEEMRR